MTRHLHRRHRGDQLTAAELWRLSARHHHRAAVYARISIAFAVIALVAALVSKLLTSG